MNVAQVSQRKHLGQRKADLNNIPEARISSTCAALLLPPLPFVHSFSDIATILTSSGRREQAGFPHLKELLSCSGGTRRAKQLESSLITAKPGMNKDTVGAQRKGLHPDRGVREGLSSF